MRCEFILTFLLFSLGYVLSEKRTLFSELNPGCLASPNCKGSTLVHIESIGPNSTYHYLWSFVKNFVPAIFVFETDVKAKLKVNWDQKFTENDTVKFENGAVHNSFAMELSNLYFINATNDVTIYTIPLEHVIWQFKNSSTSNAVKFSFESPKVSPINGTVSLSLSVFDEAGRSDYIPRLQYTQSSNVFDMTLDNIFFVVPNNKSAQAQLVSNFTFAFEGQDITSNVQENISIDDEYTPGVFQRYVYSLDSKSQSKNSATNKSAYVEWKPVAYFDSAKVIAKSIKVTSPSAKKGQLAKNSILNAYFAEKNYQVNQLDNFKFGIQDDDFDYQQNRFLQFSMAFGLNNVPEETLSMTLKIVIAVGLGLPMMLFVISIIYTIIRKLRSPNDFTTLTEDTS